MMMTIHKIPNIRMVENLHNMLSKMVIEPNNGNVPTPHSTAGSRAWADFFKGLGTKAKTLNFQKPCKIKEAINAAIFEMNGAVLHSPHLSAEGGKRRGGREPGEPPTKFSKRKGGGGAWQDLKF